MRLIKTLGLAAMAAFAAMAFVGASSASAERPTALCTVDTALKCANPYTGHVEATAGTTTLQTSAATVLCATSHILGSALGLAEPPNELLGHLELVTFNNCHTSLGVGCHVLTKELGLIHLLKLSNGTAHVRSTGTWVSVQCVGVLHCEYGGAFKVGTALSSTLPLGSSSLGLVHANATEVEKRKALALEACPAEAKWTALYSVQLPHDLFITE